MKDLRDLLLRNPPAVIHNINPVKKLIGAPLYQNGIPLKGIFDGIVQKIPQSFPCPLGVKPGQIRSLLNLPGKPYPLFLSQISALLCSSDNKLANGTFFRRGVNDSLLQTGTLDKRCDKKLQLFRLYGNLPGKLSRFLRHLLRKEIRIQDQIGYGRLGLMGNICNQPVNLLLLPGKLPLLSRLAA